MRAHTQTPSKIGVTGVTRVTPLTKGPVSLAFTPVTQLRDTAYIRCNAAQACNAKVSAQALRADAFRPSLPSNLRWLRLSSAGRGTLGYTEPETLGND